MKLSFNGLGDVIATFNGSVSVGDIISIGSSENVTKAAADKDFIGTCVSRNHNVVGILLKGAVTVRYTGTAPTIGYVGIATAGVNQVKVSTTAKKSLVVSVDTTGKTITVLL